MGLPQPTSGSERHDEPLCQTAVCRLLIVSSGPLRADRNDDDAGRESVSFVK